MSTPATPPGTHQRPLSPFMIGPYYRPQLTSILSITHRATGVGLSFGAPLLVLWLSALAAGPEAYAKVAPHVTSWYGQVVLIAFTWALLYHFCNGIRHLAWDVGKGLEIKKAETLGWIVVASSIVATAVVWALAFASRSAA